MNTKLLVTLSAVAVTMASSVIGAGAVQAAPGGTADAAFDRSVARAEDGGLVVSSIGRSSAAHTVPGTDITVPRRIPVTYRWAESAAGETSWTVSAANRLLGGAGVLQSTGPWATLSALESGTAATFAESRGLRMSQALTGINQVWGYDGPDGPGYFPGDPWTDDTIAHPANPLPYLLPSTGGSPSETWTSIRETRASGGRTIITAKAPAADGYRCTFPSIRITVKGGLIRSSNWTEICDGVTTSYASSATYTSRVAKPPRGAMTQDAAFAIPVPGQNPNWPSIVNSVAMTAAKSFTSITQTTNLGGGTTFTSPVDALLPIYTLMKNGNPGDITALVAASAPAGYEWSIVPRAGATSLATGQDRSPITAMRISATDGVGISTYSYDQRTPALASTVTTEVAFR